MHYNCDLIPWFGGRKELSNPLTITTYQVESATDLTDDATRKNRRCFKGPIGLHSKLANLLVSKHHNR
jgi:hypothetical protein